MGLLSQKELDYYIGRKEFTGDGTTTIFTLSKFIGAFHEFLNVIGGAENERVKLFIDGILYPQAFNDANNIQTINYSFEYDVIDGWAVRFITAPDSGVKISVNVKVDLKENYALTGPNVNTTNKIKQYHVTPLSDVINNFMIAYTGEDKIISKVNRTDVQFHAMRVLQELSFDTFKSTKDQEIEVPPSLVMQLPQDYVNYVKLTYKDSSGTDRIIYPQQKTSNPKAIKQETNGEYSFDINDDGVEDTAMLIHPEASDTWTSFKSASSVTNPEDFDNTYWNYLGQRYGLDGGIAQSNGNFYIDEVAGLIHFSSNISGLTITLRYISDSLGTDEEMVVHKLAEEAMYKSLMYAILSTRSNVTENIVQRYKRERFAAIRTAKLRLSNIKLEELTQILRGQSKFIKH